MRRNFGPPGSFLFETNTIEYVHQIMFGVLAAFIAFASFPFFIFKGMLLLFPYDKTALT